MTGAETVDIVLNILEYAARLATALGATEEDIGKVVAKARASAQAISADEASDRAAELAASRHR